MNKQFLGRKSSIFYFPYNEDNIDQINISYYLEYNYQKILDLYDQKKYRKVFLEIKRFERIFLICPNYWKLSNLKIKAIEKIIDRKLIKIKEVSNISSIIKWLQFKEKEIEHLINNIINQVNSINNNESIDNKRENKIEIVITYVLKQCLQFAKLSIHEGYVFDSIAFLAIGENIIKNTSDFIFSPDSLFVIQKIYLFLSSLNIMNDNYDTARKYLILLLKLSLKEIEVRTDSTLKAMIIIDKLKKNEIEQIKKIFFNITTALYHLGVCYENENKLKEASQAYKQSNWFAYSFQRGSHPELVKFLSSIYKRILLRQDLIQFFKEQIREYQSNKDNNNEDDQMYTTEDKRKKQRELIEYIEGFKITSIDDDNHDLLNKIGEKPMSERVNIVTNTVNILNHLMSSKFKSIVNQMKKVEINKLPNDIKSLIQKKINSIKQFQKEKLYQSVDHNRNNLYCRTENHSNLMSNHANLPMSFSKDSQIILNYKYQSNNNTNSTKNTQAQSTTILLSPSETHKEIKLFKKDEDITYNSRNSNNEKQKCHYKKTQSHNQPEKFSYSNYIFNKDFKKKSRVLEYQYNRELKFQKQLLKSKTEEKVFLNPSQSEQSIIDQCSYYFKSTLQNNICKINENKNEKTNTIEYTYRKRQTTLKPRAMSGISCYSPFDNIRVDRFNKDKEPNKLYLNNIEQDIVLIKKKKLFLKKQLFQRNNRIIKK